MKSSSSSLRGLVLTLLMVILVLLALFWFLYRGWGPLEEQAQQAAARATRVVGLEDELRQKDEVLTAVQATGTAVAVELNTAIDNHQLAEKELIAQQEANNLLLTRVFTQTTILESQAAATPSAPQVAILEPAAGGIAPVGEPLTITAVAADAAGLAAVWMTHEGEVVTQTLNGETLRVVATTWIPQAAGDFTVAVTAVNVAQISSQVVSVTVQIQDPDVETAAFLQTLDAILGTPSGVGPVNAPQALAGDGRLSAADPLFRRAFDFPLPTEGSEAGGLGDYCQFGPEPLPANPLAAPAARLAYIRAVVRQQQLETYDLAGQTAVLTNQDARAALCALAEGHIRLAQLLYIDQTEPDLQAALLASLDQTPAIAPEASSDIVNAQQLFSIDQGLDFVRLIYDLEGGWQGVATAWQQPPRSTKHVLHPETYLAGADAPQPVTLPPLAGVVPAGWSLADEGVLGEWMLGQYLRQGLDTPTAVAMADGWSGDQYAIYSDPAADEWLLAWQTLWDTPEDVQTFAANYDVYLTNLLGAPGLAVAVRPGVRCWDGRAEAVCLYATDLLGQNRTIVVRAPDRALALEVLDVVSEAGA